MLVFAGSFFICSAVFASAGNTTGYAWSDQIGWVRFGCDNCNTNVTDSALTGYAWNDNHGWIKLDASSPDGTAGVKNNGNGVLSGQAWGDNVGWINFAGVTINASSGKLGGTATGDSRSNIVGTLSFDCTTCNVQTSWQPSCGNGICNGGETCSTCPADCGSCGGGGGSSSGVNGACGIANNTSSYSIPTTNLCSAGTPSAVTGSGPWTWTCSGLYGGLASSTCTANKALNFPAGCTSILGYSITTGLSCSGISLVNLPAGCTSTSGYSITTGLPCSGTILVTPPTIPTPPVCAPYMTKYIQLGVANDSAEVKKLQDFLIKYEGFSDLAETGIYDDATYNAVKAFQLKYANDILTPWGFTAPTGYVQRTTIKKINEIYCKAQPNSQQSNVSNVFTQLLVYGSNGGQVVLLQDTLKKLGFFPQSIKSNGNFGPATLKAVQAFQIYYKITKPGIIGYGQVGPNTRRVLNQLINQ